MSIDRPIVEAIAQICSSLGGGEALQLRPGQAYFVGGCVRDWLLGRPVRDIDLVVSGDPKAFGRTLVERLRSGEWGLGGSPTLFCLDLQRSTYRIAWSSGLTIDINPLGETIEANLRSRDFTVDAMAVRSGEWRAPEAPFGGRGPGREAAPGMASGEFPSLIDPTGGLTDLRERRLRMVSAPNLDADLIRLLRAGRLVAELDLEVEPETQAAIAARAEKVAGAAAERIGEELMSALAAPHCPKGIRWLARVGVLFALMPELREMVGVGQNANHHLDVWDHTLVTVDCVQELLGGGSYPAAIAAGHAGSPAGPEPDRQMARSRAHSPEPTWRGSARVPGGAAPWRAPARTPMDRPGAEAPTWPGAYPPPTCPGGFPLGALVGDLSRDRPGIRSRRGVLQLAALLHDIAKPRTRALNPRGEISFWHHDEMGAGMAGEICERLRLSRRERDLCTRLVRHHLHPAFLGTAEMPTERALYRLVRLAGDWLPELLLLGLADRLSALGPYVTTEMVERQGRIASALFQRWQERRTRPAISLLNGKDVMEILGVGEGPVVGECLRALAEAQALGEIGDREEAIEFLQAHCGATSGGPGGPACA